MNRRNITASILLISLSLFLRANAESSNDKMIVHLLQNTPSTCTEILSSENGEISIQAEIQMPPLESVSSYTIVPCAMETSGQIASLLLGVPIDQLIVYEDEYVLRYTDVTSSDSETIKRSLDVFKEDQYIGYLDIDLDMNGDVIDSTDAPNCALTRAQAVAMAREFLVSLGIDNVVLLKADTCVAINATQTGFYYLAFAPLYNNIPCVSNIQTGVSYSPKVTFVVTDKGLASINGRFVYTVEEKKELNSVLSIDDAIERLESMMDIVLLDAAPLPIEKISYEHFSVMESNGTCTLRPVWVFRADADKMTEEWLDAGLRAITFIVYADDGTIAYI